MGDPKTIPEQRKEMQQTMRPVKVPKIVRDNMESIWIKYGDKVEYEFLGGQALKDALARKVVEEATEVLEDRTLEEYADVLEILIASANAEGFKLGDIYTAMRKKRAERGGFTKGLYLTKFEWGNGQKTDLV